MTNDKKHHIAQSTGQFLIYQAEDGSIKLEVRLVEFLAPMGITQRQLISA